MTVFSSFFRIIIGFMLWYLSLSCYDQLPLIGCLKQQTQFLSVLGDWQSPRPALQICCLVRDHFVCRWLSSWWCPHMVESGDRKQASGHQSHSRAHLHDLITLPWPHLQIPSHWGLGFMSLGLHNPSVHT